jgi:hypothetical protein
MVSESDQVNFVFIPPNIPATYSFSLKLFTISPEKTCPYSNPSIMNYLVLNFLEQF